MQNKKIDLSNFDFVDFGCSGGDSIAFANKHLGGCKGLGIDIDNKKLRTARESGFSVVRADLTNHQNFGGKVRFSIMSHFLEHLPSLTVAAKCIDTGIRLSREFLLIRQPWFDSDGSLFRDGMKLYWSHWSGHPNHMTTLNFYLILSPYFQKGIISRFVIFGSKPIKSSQDDAIHPKDSPINQHAYDETIHGPKPIKTFDYDVYREVVVMVLRQRRVDIGALMRTLRELEPIYDSSGKLI